MRLFKKDFFKEIVKKFILFFLNPVVPRTRYIQELDYLFHEQCKVTIRFRFRYKILKNEKINILFVCHRPQLWGSLKTVFEAINSDSHFNVTIVAIPNKKQLPRIGWKHETYVSEGAEEYFRDFPCKVINGYNYENKTWVSLRTLDPDYCFFQSPYSGSRPVDYDIRSVSQYANICYVHYGADTVINQDYESFHPFYFICYLYMIFCQSAEYENFIKNIFLQNKKYFYIKSHITGFPRYDNLNTYKNTECNIWKFPKSENKFRIIWTPRWTTQENLCNFFVFKDKFFDYADNNHDIDFVFRPHPHGFADYIYKKQMSLKDVEHFKIEYNRRKNMTIDYNKDYLPQFYTSDVLVTDTSSLLCEYFLTDKPIIYCHRKNYFNSFTTNLSEGFYWAYNWDDVKKYLEQLKSGNDPLREKRLQIKKNEYFIPPEGAGNRIKNLILDDFFERI